MSRDTGYDDDRDTPTPVRDPRLEIPQVLREPIDHPSIRPKKPSVLSGSMGEVGIALAIGIDFFVMVAAGGGLGWLVDRQLGWAPAGLMVGLGLGFAAGLVRLLHRLSKDDAATRAGARKGVGRGGGPGVKN
jgi:ATP synthase protein I